MAEKIDPFAIHADLKTQGFSLLPSFDFVQTKQIELHFYSFPVHRDAHVPQTARNRNDPQPIPRELCRDSECVCVPTFAAITAPHIFERALSLTDVAASYLECDPPVMYSANAFWTRPGPAGTRPDIQEMHRDLDDTRFLAMFVFLTDVADDGDGPQDLTGPDGVVRTIRGFAGTCFLADTSRDHRGRKPWQRERGLAWVRWGVSPRPPANEWDKIEPIPAAALGPGRYPSDPRLRESIKLLVKG